MSEQVRATAASAQPQPPERDDSDFYQRVEAHAFRPLWRRPEAPTEPRALARPAIWRLEAARALLIEAGERLGLGGEAGIDRRVLTMKNPTVPDGSATRTLSAALQLVHPGEAAPSHRHTLAALRFIIEGDGGSTIVDGTAVPMEPGDLILTPSWSWHGHAHAGSETMLWLDVLDAPLVGALDVGFYEEYATPKVLQAASGDPSRARSATVEELLPTSEHRSDGEVQPLLRYGFAAAVGAVERLRRERPSPDRSYLLTFSDPTTGGPVMTTIDASMLFLEAGARSVAHRDTANRVYHVARGAGYSTLDGERFDWAFGDTFCVPSWCAEEHVAGEGEAVLFVASDLPVMRSLGLYRVDAGRALEDSPALVTAQVIAPATASGS